MTPEQLQLTTGLVGAIIGGSASVLTIVVQQHFNAKIERMRLHQVEILDGYRELYAFVTQVEDVFSPPEDPVRDFKDVMKRCYIPKVKPHTLFFIPRIRALLSILENQYACLVNPDLIAQPAFDEFIKRELGAILEKVRRLVEGRTDTILGV